MRRALALASAAALVSSAAWAATEIPVRTTQLREVRPAAGSGYLAWGQDSRRRPNRYAVYVQSSAGGRPMRISRPGKQGVPGGISGTTLVYQESFGTASDLRFYDLSRKRHIAVPRGVNTRQSGEWAATLSGDNLLFSRFNERIERVLLRNIRTGSSTQLDSGPIYLRGGSRVVSGQINGTFAVWTKCASRQSCTVYRYEVETKVKTPLVPPSGRIHYAPSVSPEGTVYLARSKPECGAGVEIWRYPVAGIPAKLFSLPPGWDVQTSYALSFELKPPTIVTRNEVYYDRERCRGNRFDLYKFVDVIRGPPQP